jgi:DNA ligase-1
MERIGGALTNRAPKLVEGSTKIQAVPPTVLLANKWTPDIDPTGWWVSEKLDGIRAIWTGTEFISRLGNKFSAPEWFTKDLGKQRIDGELWMGRGKFQQAVSIIKTQGLDKEWHNIKYLVFDLPDSKKDFEGRYEEMQNLNLPSHCQVVEQAPCGGVDQLRKMLKALEEKGAEGLMLRQAHSMYEGKRSSTLLKVKTFHDDEATITAYEPGKGRHKGRLGGYTCVLKTGKQFNVGTGLTDKDRNNPLKIGTKITFRFVELTDDGIPRFPVYVSERIDA